MIIKLLKKDRGFKLKKVKKFCQKILSKINCKKYSTIKTLGYKKIQAVIILSDIL